MSCGALREVGAPQARLLLEGSNNKHDARYNNRAASECVATDGAVDRRRIVMGGLAKNARRKAEGKTAVTSPMPLEAIRRFDALFDIERVILDRILRVDRTLSIEGGLRRSAALEVNSRPPLKDELAKAFAPAIVKSSRSW